MTQPSHPPSDPLTRIFAYRAIDLRDRFPQPLESFREALECLQSDRSYMAAMSGEIIAYLRGGYSLTIPDEFFIRSSGEIDATLVPPDENDGVCTKAEAWLREMLMRPDVDTTKGVPAEERPYSLDQLLAQCDPQAPPPDELQAWQDMPDVGSEVVPDLSAHDVRGEAEKLFGNKEKAQSWLKKPLKQFGGRSPEETLREDPRQVYDLLLQIKHGFLI